MNRRLFVIVLAFFCQLAPSQATIDVRLLATYEGRGASPVLTTYSPDHSRAVTVGPEEDLILWDAVRWVELGRWKRIGACTNVLAVRGTRALVTYAKTLGAFEISCLDFASGKIVEIDKLWGVAGAFSGDGRTLAYISQANERETSLLIATVDFAALAIRTRHRVELDGRGWAHLAFGSDEQTLHVSGIVSWFRFDGDRVHERGEAIDFGLSLDTSKADSKFTKLNSVLSPDRLVRKSIDKRGREASHRAHAVSPNGLVFSPDGKFLAISTGLGLSVVDRVKKSVRSYPGVDGITQGDTGPGFGLLRAGRMIRWNAALGQGGASAGIAYPQPKSGELHPVVAATEGGVIVYPSADVQIALVRGRSVKFADVDSSNTLVERIDLIAKHPVRLEVAVVANLKTSSCFLSTLPEGLITLFDRVGETVFRVPSYSSIQGLAFSPRGTWLAFGSWSRLYFVETKEYRDKREQAIQGLEWLGWIDESTLLTRDGGHLRAFAIPGFVKQEVVIDHKPSCISGAIFPWDLIPPGPGETAISAGGKLLAMSAGTSVFVYEISKRN